MSTEEKDVKPGEDQTQTDTSSDEYDPEDDLENRESLFGPEEDDEVDESDKDEDDDESPDEDEGDDDEEDPESDPVEALKKKDEQIANLNKALSIERQKARSQNGLTAPTPVGTAPNQAPSQQPQGGQITDNVLIQANEKEAMMALYKEFPELAPENDTNNVMYNRVLQTFPLFAKEYAEKNGVPPVSKEAILETAREAIGYIQYRDKVVEKRKFRKREGQKAQMATMGASAHNDEGSKRSSLRLSESDRRAARAAKQTEEQYAKNVSVFEDANSPV